MVVWLMAAVLLLAPDTGFTLPEMTGLIEGIAFRPATGAFYFGDVHHRCVWQRAADGTVTRFTAPDDRLLGVFRIEIDEGRGVAWAAMSAVPQMDRYAPEMKGRAGIAEIDLATGAVRRIGLVPSDGANHVIGDLMVLVDGTVLATDSAAPVLWTWTPGQPQLEPLVRSELFASLQGITWTGDKVGVFLTDYRNGLLFVDRYSQRVRTIAAPAGANLRGCDTLVRMLDGTLLAIQNGTAQQRVLRLTVSPDRTAVTQVDVVAADPAMADATLGTIVGQDFVFVADGGWNRFEPGKVNAAPRGVPVLRVPLSSAAAK
jgi:hypothetical protein